MSSAPSYVPPLQTHLLQQAISAEECDALLGPFRRLTARILGAVPRFTQLAHTSAPTTKFYCGALRSCLHIPVMDFGFTVLKPHHRRLATLTSSMVHKCTYCMGHCVAVGDMLGGALPAQVSRGKREKSQVGDDVLKKVVKEICMIPAGLKKETKREYEGVFGAQGWNELVSMVCFMGWLNYCMGSLCMQLEGSMAPFARKALGEIGAQVELDVADDGEEQAAERKMKQRMGMLENVMELVGLVPSIVRATGMENAWWRDIPAERGVEEWARKEVGSVPMFILGSRGNLKRALAFGMREFLIKDVGGVGWRGRVLLMGVFGVGVGNERMIEDAAALLESGEKQEEDLGELFGVEEGTDKAEWVKRVGAEATTRVRHLENGELDKAAHGLELAACYVVAAAAEAGGVREALQKMLVDHMRTQYIVDLAGMIGFFGMAHRALVVAQF